MGVNQREITLDMEIFVSLLFFKSSLIYEWWLFGVYVPSNIKYLNHTEIMER